MNKYYTFYRENNDFKDILTDTNIKKVIYLKLTWWQHLMIGIPGDGNEQTLSYLTLKYGDDMKVIDVKDFTPVPGVDYVPKKDKNRYKKRIS